MGALCTGLQSGLRPGLRWVLFVQGNNQAYGQDLDGCFLYRVTIRLTARTCYYPYSYQ